MSTTYFIGHLGSVSLAAAALGNMICNTSGNWNSSLVPSPLSSPFHLPDVTGLNLDICTVDALVCEADGSEHILGARILYLAPSALSSLSLPLPLPHLE